MIKLKKYELLDQILNDGNGFLKTSTVLSNHISKPTLAKYVRDRGLKRAAHGIYVSEDAWPDEYFLLSLQNTKIIFSHESALYLYSLMDREPSGVTVTVPKGYNSTKLVEKGIRVFHIKAEWYEMGLTSVNTIFGNEVPVYDRDRTICDIIRRKKDVEIQTFQTAMQEYMRSKDKNLNNLMKYAAALGIEKEVKTYTEVML